MHKVERNTAPLRLVDKDIRWKQLLVERPDSEHEWDKFGKTKLKAETLKQLEAMYKGCCCYCEAKVGVVSYPEIEHFKPKSRAEYKHLCYDYNNLQYCCRKCNLAKSDEYDDKMVSPSYEDAGEHFVYEKYVAKAVDNRGQIMIETIGLNSRKELENSRITIFDRFEKLYNATVNCIVKLKDTELTLSEIGFIKIFIDAVNEESKNGNPFCSMIKYNFYEKAQTIEKILIGKGYLLNCVN